MFRTELLSIIRSLKTVYTVISVCHVSYVDCLQQTVNITSMTNTHCCVYSVETPDDGQEICPKHAEFFTKINLRNSASRLLLLL